MAIKTIFALAFLVAAISAQIDPCYEMGGGCLPRRDCQEAILPLPGACNDYPGDVCCAVPKRSEPIQGEPVQKCANGAGECISDCPIAIRHFTNECPAGKYCCVWL